jgi:hypothetical protein
MVIIDNLDEIPEINLQKIQTLQQNQNLKTNAMI